MAYLFYSYRFVPLNSFTYFAPTPTFLLRKSLFHGLSYLLVSASIPWLVDITPTSVLTGIYPVRVFSWPSLVRMPVTLDQGPALLHQVLVLI